MHSMTWPAPSGAASVACLSTSWRGSVKTSVPPSCPPRAKPAGLFANFSASTSSSSESSAARSERWPRWLHCWCRKRTSRRCWRARTNDVRPAAPKVARPDNPSLRRHRRAWSRLAARLACRAAVCNAGSARRRPRETSALRISGA